MVRILIGITGTPGTGKKSVGRILAKELDYEFLDINSLAKGEKDEKGELILDLKALRKDLNLYLKDKRAIVVGHLLPYVLAKKGVRLIVVLRCAPYELEERLKKRSYSYEKIKENVTSEILGIILYDAFKKFGKSKICEIDTTNRKEEEVVKEILEILEYRRSKPLGIVDWLALVEKDEKLLKFLQT
ncbi:MAG: adenylate kinase family protein [Nitrososphaerales archaeon]